MQGLVGMPEGMDRMNRIDKMTKGNNTFIL